MRGSGAFRTGAAPGGALAPRWTQRRLWRAARAVPSLDLRFADSKSLVDSVTGQSLVTFTRASNATYVDSTGTLQTASTDVPRFNHNPLTGESLGLLVEEQRTNLLLRSEEFGTTWATISATVSADTNETVSPAGANTADKLTSTAGTAIKSVFQGFTSVTGTYTFSVYAKKSTHDFIQFFYGGTGLDYANFNIATGVTGATVGTSSIISVGNGWYRCVHTFTASSNTSTNIALIDAITSARAATSTNVNSIYLWGAQLEAGAFPTSYIPTTSATATRSADVASIGSFNGPVGCLFAQFSNPASGSRGIASVNDNSANNRIDLRTSGTDPFLTVVNGGTTQADIDAGTISANTVARLSGRVTTDNFGASIAGGTEVLDTSGSVPTVTQLQIGRDQASNYLNGRLARLAVWAQPLNTLQALTQ